MFEFNSYRINISVSIAFRYKILKFKMEKNTHIYDLLSKEIKLPECPIALNLRFYYIMHW